MKAKYRIFAKVRLNDVACCPKNHPCENAWFKKIRGYHVDFVLCDPETTAPLCVIELDDRRHRERPRKSRDEFKDQVLQAAGMPVIRVVAQQAYDPVEIAEQVRLRIEGR